MQKSIIKIDNLIFDYIQVLAPKDMDEEPVKVPHRAITDISLEVNKGEFVAVIGRNGSGKSTLAKCINGLLTPTEGVVYVKGWDTKIEDYIWNIRQTAGMVFQNPDNQLVSAIVEDDVAFGPENMGVPTEEIRRRVDKALKAVDIYDQREKAPHLLSGGQKQRVAVAGAIAMKPEIIIFDEPTAMLDPSGRKDIMDIIKELNEEGITIVLITHYMEDAACADKIFIMNEGEIALAGTPKEVFKERDFIKKMHLDLPFAVELAYQLRQRGIRVPEDIVDTKGMVDYLCQLKQKI